MKSGFSPIDMKSFPMAEEFYYYTQIAPTSYSITLDIDVTETKNALKESGLKFFPAYMYLVSRGIANRPELRVAVLDGTLGHYDFLNPCYPQLNKKTLTTSLLFTEYDPSFRAFYEAYCNDTRLYGDSTGILTKKGIPPKNGFVISCIPWFTFKSFSLHNHGIKDYYFPSFEAGAFRHEDDRILMPLSVTAHHATTEGIHLNLFFDELDEFLSNPKLWIYD